MSEQELRERSAFTASDFVNLPEQSWPQQWHPNAAFKTPQSVSLDAFDVVVDDGLSYSDSRKNYRLGAPQLPVAPYREHIVDTIVKNQTTIFTSPTGTGKSSQTGLYLLEEGSEHGIDRVFISSPRILAARELMGWARKGLGYEYEQLAGYLTGTASDSDAGPETRLLFVTEQLLAKMVNRGEITVNDVVVNDEAHERGVASIVLQGLMREKMQDDPRNRLVISSATIDSLKNAKFSAHTVTNKPAPIIALRGVTHPITDIHTNRKLPLVAKEYMANHNVLAFEPGETRQHATIGVMSNRKEGHRVHLLNATLSPADQARALDPADKNHIVGNRIAETSITPENKDVVVDSGLSNIGKYEAGVKVLKTIHSSQATMTQRRGRVGRTRPGIYIAAEPENAPPIAYEDRQEYDPSPIETSSVASYIVELLVSGKRIENLPTSERPTGENLAHDYKLLQRIGAITLHDGVLELTKIGRDIANLPLDVHYGRMLVEARSIDTVYEVDTESVRAQVAAAVAVRQVAGILNARDYSRRRYKVTPANKDPLSREHYSDMLFELDVFINMYQKQQEFNLSEESGGRERFDMFLRSKDVLVNRYYKALQTYEELCLREELSMDSLTHPTKEERRAIIGCQITGTEELFVQKSAKAHRDIRGTTRRLGKRSTIEGSRARLVVGSPFDYVGMQSNGHFKRSFILSGSIVTKEQLEQHASHRISYQKSGHSINEHGDFLQHEKMFFDNELLFSEKTTALDASIESREFVIRAMMKGVVRSGRRGSAIRSYDPGTEQAAKVREQWAKAQEYQHKTSGSLGINKRYDQLIARVVRDSVTSIPLDVTNPAILDTVIPDIHYSSLFRPNLLHKLPEIAANAPDYIEIPVDSEQSISLPVKYRYNTARLRVPYELLLKLDTSMVEEIAENHPIMIAVGNNNYLPAQQVFELIEKRKSTRERRAAASQKAKEDTLALSEPAARNLRPHKKGTIAKQSKKVQKSLLKPTAQQPERKKKRGSWRSFRMKSESKNGE